MLQFDFSTLGLDPERFAASKQKHSKHSKISQKCRERTAPPFNKIQCCYRNSYDNLDTNQLALLRFKNVLDGIQLSVTMITNHDSDRIMTHIRSFGLT